MKLKQYVTPSMHFSLLDHQDVIVTSGDGYTGETQNYGRILELTW